MKSSFYKFVSYVILFFFRGFVSEERREEKKFQDKEHDEKFNQDYGPQRASECHASETVAVKSPYSDGALSNHCRRIENVMRQR